MAVNRLSGVLAAVLVFSVSTPGLHAQGQPPSLEARVNLNVADRTLEDVVTDLRNRSGANIVIIDTEAKAISKETISIELVEVPWRDALDLVAEKVGAIVELRTAGVLAITLPQRVTFEFPNSDIRQVIDTIAKYGSANIVMAPEVTGTISVRFNGVPWREALDVVAKTLNFTVVEEGHGVLRVVDPIKLQDQQVTRTYQFRYLRPKSLYKPILKSNFVETPQQQQQQQGQGQTTADVAKTFTVLQSLSKALTPNLGVLDYVDSQNAIVVRDTVQVHDAIKELLTRLDVEPLQVFCDVKFVTTTNLDVLNLGVDYGDAGPQVSLSGGAIPTTFPFNEGSGGWEDWLIASPSGEGPFVDPALNGGDTFVPDTIFGALSFTQVQATLRLLQRDTKAEVIQAPKIFAIDGSEATIFVGETIRYAEAKTEQGQSGGLQLSVTEASGSPVEVGFQLLIKPNVVPGTQKIRMEVIPKETSLSGTGQSTIAPAGFDVFIVGASGLEGAIALPRTRSSTIVSTMMVDSGKTVMIGGLTTDSDTQTKTKVPILGDIPLIGDLLFKHRVKNRDRRSLLVFLTPSIVHSSEDTDFLLRQELMRRRTKLKDEINQMISAAEASAPADPAATPE
jgi:type IV pilus assembly protein PilQ